MKEQKTKSNKKEELKGYFSRNSLGDSDKFDRYFSISEINPDNLTMDAIRHKMVEKIDFFSKVLEELLQPEASMQCLYECKAIDEGKRKEIFSTYRKLKSMSRESDMIDLESSDAQNREFIKKAFAEWEGIKNTIKPLLKELKDSWESEDIQPLSEARYLG